VDVTASLGVTALRAGEEPAAAIGRVDALMYRAKRAGRDRVAVDDGEDPPDPAPPDLADVQRVPRNPGQDGGSSHPRRADPLGGQPH
jgi:hypothetical protein